MIHITRCLSAGTWIFLACALTVTAEGLWRPARLRLPPVNVAPAESSLETPLDSNISLDDLAPIWTRDLRQALVDPPPKAPSAVQQAPPPAPPSLPRLLATFVGADHAWGLFLDASGLERVRPVGGSIDLFEIVEINRGSAKLKHGERTFDVHVRKDHAEATRPSRG